MANEQQDKVTPKKPKKAPKPRPEPPKPNYVFIGGRFDVSAKDVKPNEKGFVPREPIKGFTDGSKHYKLPDVKTQLKGPFYFEGPPINRLFGGLYKSYVDKGAKS